jgi:hypothetical protein
VNEVGVGIAVSGSTANCSALPQGKRARTCDQASPFEDE